ncbi:hypothetical protein NQ152_11750 [Microbacterium sp. zg.B48]|uniref:hypothetical protein n=1 Tax=Microbacterium sp. zg.B48 TaxID=2969408 RepID=UPI00214C9C74|nr:hypothetical protein [Microbacterium sp. zg.B48]MCR2764176.1 hypothetical protein [Microbacterium sp. zg.B48]
MSDAGDEKASDAAPARAEDSGAGAADAEQSIAPGPPAVPSLRRAGREQTARAQDGSPASPARGTPVAPAAAGTQAAPVAPAPPVTPAPPVAPGAARPGPDATSPAILRPAAPPAPQPASPRAAVEPPSPDVAPVQAESALPGTHRGGFERWPTAPVGVTPIVTAPDLDAPVLWAEAEPAVPSRGMAAWALGIAIVAFVVSMFVGWGIPLGVAAIVTAIIALRRPIESRAVGVWALVLGVVSLLYSAGWLLFAATRMGMFG